MRGLVGLRVGQVCVSYDWTHGCVLNREKWACLIVGHVVERERWACIDGGQVDRNLRREVGLS